MQDGKRGKAKVYGPVRGGDLTIELGDGVTVRRNGKKVKPRKDDKRAPKTRVRIRHQGAKAVLRFKVRDASPVTTYVKLGKRTRTVKKQLRLPAARLRKGLLVQSVDAFGNVERAKKIRGAKDKLADGKEPES